MGAIETRNFGLGNFMKRVSYQKEILFTGFG